MAYRIGVIGAQETVGREVLQVLAERGDLPRASVRALAPSLAAGGNVSFGDDDELRLESVERVNWRDFDLVFNAGSAEMAGYTQAASQGGAVVIDLGPALRLEGGVPLVAAHVNPQALAHAREAAVIACPSAAAGILAHVLAPIHKQAGILRAVVTSFTAASSSGQEAMDELFSQTRAVFVNDPIQPEFFPKQIAFNLIPQVGRFRDDGATEDEWNLMAEVKKLIDPKLKLVATSVQAPVFIGQAFAVTLEMENEFPAEAAEKLLRRVQGVAVVNHRIDEAYVTPVEVAGEDKVFVSRIRDDFTVENGLGLWVVGDNLRAPALEAVEVAALWHIARTAKAAKPH